MDVFYSESRHAYIVSNNKFDRSLEYIDSVLEYSKTIGLTVPEKKYISVRIIQTKRYNNCLSVEFQSMTEPTTGTFLVRTSPEWKWLINKYK